MGFFRELFGLEEKRKYGDFRDFMENPDTMSKEDADFAMSIEIIKTGLEDEAAVDMIRRTAHTGHLDSCMFMLDYESGLFTDNFCDEETYRELASKWGLIYGNFIEFSAQIHTKAVERKGRME